VVEALSLRLADCVTAVSPQVVKLYERKYPWLRGRLNVTSPGVDSSDFSLRPRQGARQALGLSPEGNILLYVGRLDKEKNVPLLTRAFQVLKSRIRRLSLIIVGEGPERGNIERLVREQGIEGVTMVGAVPHNVVSTYMNAADVLILCSTTEGSPTVLKEAARCGLPIVATRVGDASELSSKVPHLPVVVRDFVGAAELALAVESVLRLRQIDREVAAREAELAFSFGDCAEALSVIYQALASANRERKRISSQH
jgi:glycosyltransferase involved in cell wall biosynthesis